MSRSRQSFRTPTNPSARSLGALVPGIVLLIAGIYAGISFLGESLPDSFEPAFRPDVVRWVLVGAAVVAVLALFAIDARRRAATEAYATQMQMAEEFIRRAEDAAALTEANRGLNRAAPENLMEAVARGAMVTVGAARAEVFAYDEDRDVMTPIGWTATQPEDRTMSEPVGRAFATQQPVLSNDPPPSSVSAPITVGDEIAGVVVSTAEGKRFGDRELRILASYAADAAVAINRARALERERQVSDRLVEIDRAKNDFVAAITHELKTPLTSLLG
ncbi:MAG: GAF domain-containing protein, partial [Actinobacteria bacterium]|nr:GAF domain-containing protein [Actinomycetota bacterium]